MPFGGGRVGRDRWSNELGSSTSLNMSTLYVTLEKMFLRLRVHDIQYIRKVVELSPGCEIYLLYNRAKCI